MTNPLLEFAADPWNPQRLFGGYGGGFFEVRPWSCWFNTNGTILAKVGEGVARLNDLTLQDRSIHQEVATQRPTLGKILKDNHPNARAIYYLNFDGVDDLLQINLPTMGSNVTEWYASVSDGIVINTELTVESGLRNLPSLNDLVCYGIINRALTEDELEKLTHYLNFKAGINTESESEEPSAFTPEMWSLSSSGSDSITVTINNLPASNGATITDIEYSLNSGSWVSSEGISTFIINDLTPNTEYTVELRAVNSEGAGAAGDSKAAVTDAAAIVSDQTAYFGTATPSGAGGWMPFDNVGEPVALTGGVTVVSGSPSRTWSISGGTLIANGTPDVDDGVVLSVTTVDSDVVEVTIDASTYDGESIATGSEFSSLINAPSRLSGKSHIFRCRDISLDGINYYNRFAGSEICHFGPERDDVRRPKLIGEVTITGPSATGNCHWQGLDFFMECDETQWKPADPLSRTIFLFGDGDHLHLDNCRFFGDAPSSSADGFLKEPISAIFVRDGMDVVIENCEIHNVWYGIRVTDSTDGTKPIIKNNHIHHFWADSVAIASSGGVIQGNRIHSAAGWGSIIHPDIIQFQGNNRGEVVIEGNVFAPGSIGIMRPGSDPVVTSINVTAPVTLNNSTHIQANVRASGTGDVTLPSGDTVPVDAEYIVTGVSGSTITLVAADGDSVEGDILPKTLSSNNSFGVQWTGSAWRAKHYGTKIGQTIKTQINDLLDNDKNQEQIHDTRNGAMVRTLPASPSNNDKYMFSIYDNSNSLTIEPNSGQSMSVNGDAAEECVIESVLQGKTFTWNSGTSTWVVRDTYFGNQGVFSNSYTFDDDIRIQGNIFAVNQTWGVRIEGSESTLPPNVIVSHNLMLPYFGLSDLNGDGYYGPGDGGFVYGTEVSIESRGATNWITDRNIANIYINAGAGTPHVLDNDEFGLTISDVNSHDQSKITDKIVGNVNAWPTTIEGIIAAAELAEDHRTGEYFGPHAYWDFETNTRRTPPAAVALSASGQEGQPFAVMFNQPVNIGSGSVVLYDETADEEIETFDVTDGIYGGDTVSFDPTISLELDNHTLSVRFDDTCFEGIYNKEYIPAITNDSLSFQVTGLLAAGEPVLIPDANTYDTSIHSTSQTPAFTPDGSIIVLAHIMPQSNFAASPTAPTLTIITDPNGDSIESDPFILDEENGIWLPQISGSNSCLAWILPDVASGIEIALKINNNFGNSKGTRIQVYNMSNISSIGGTYKITGGGPTTRTMSVTTTQDKSRVIYMAMLNNTIDQIEGASLLYNNEAVFSIHNSNAAQEYANDIATYSAVLTLSGASSSCFLGFEVKSSIG